MSDEIEDLKKKLEEAERKAAIWRSQVVVLLLVFLVGGAAVHLWTRASFASRLEKVEARVVNVTADSVVKRKVVEAEAFILRDATGRVRMELGKKGQIFFDEHGKGLTVLEDGSFQMFDTEGDRVFLLEAPRPPGPGSGLFAIINKTRDTEDSSKQQAVFMVALNTSGATAPYNGVVCIPNLRTDHDASVGTGEMPRLKP